MQNATQVTWKSAFLDTNALVALFSYWQVCTSNRITLDSVVSLQDLKAKLGARIRLAKEIPADDYDPIRVGMRCFQNLTAARDRYLFYTSALCRSELHHVVLTSIASERLTRRRVPHALRVKRPQIIYRRALETSDYSTCATQLDEFIESLRLDYSVAIQEVEDPGSGAVATFETILEAARHVWSRVLIEVMDAYIFAAALMAEVDVFVTADEALRDALSKLNEPSTLWKAAARSLNIALGKGQSEALPIAMRPTGQLP